MTYEQVIFYFIFVVARTMSLRSFLFLLAFRDFVELIQVPLMSWCPAQSVILSLIILLAGPFKPFNGFNEQHRLFSIYISIKLKLTSSSDHHWCGQSLMYPGRYSCMDADMEGDWSLQKFIDRPISVSVWLEQADCTRLITALLLSSFMEKHPSHPTHTEPQSFQRLCHKICPANTEMG